MTVTNNANFNNIKTDIHSPGNMGFDPQNKEDKIYRTQWAGRIIECLNVCDRKIDEFIPDNIIQQTIDSLSLELKEKFQPFTEFNQWLEENDCTEWYTEVANYLVKLPLRSARNIISGLYSVISTACYISSHPLKGINYLQKSIVSLLDELTNPEIWTKIGGGTIGVIAGRSLILGNPLSLMGMGIGIALVVYGISMFHLLSLDEDEKVKVLKDKLSNDLKKLPESILTGFFSGLLFGGIERVFNTPVEISGHGPQREFDEWWDCGDPWSG